MASLSYRPGDVAGRGAAGGALCPWDDAPDAGPTLVERAREIYRRRRRREQVFGCNLFADPVWDILLDLFIAQAESRMICVSSACIGASVPTTTALRHINYMVEAGLLKRVPHPNDSRSRLLELTGEAVGRMTDYLVWETVRDGAGEVGREARLLEAQCMVVRIGAADGG